MKNMDEIFFHGDTRGLWVAFAIWVIVMIIGVFLSLPVSKVDKDYKTGEVSSYYYNENI